MSSSEAARRGALNRRLRRIVQRMSFLVLIWALVMGHSAWADGGRKDLGVDEDHDRNITALALAGCQENEGLTVETNPECFSVVTETSTGWLMEVYVGSLAERARVSQWPRCHSFVLTPAENTWSRGLRGCLYLFGLLYAFLGLAILSEVFMAAIESITSQKKIGRDGEETFVWNAAVANITLMALGTSAPEVLLNVVSVGFALTEEADPLGPGAVVGSASYNLLMITAVCIVAAVPDIKKIERMRVFGVTSIFSVWAYIWLFIILNINTPAQVELWEALITLLQFPLLVFVAYGQDVQWRIWCFSRRPSGVVDPEDKVANEESGETHRMRNKYIEYRRNIVRWFTKGKRSVKSVNNIVDEAPEFDSNEKTSDPYCKVLVNGVEKRTAWKLKKLNPQWNEKFAFELDSESAMETNVILEVWDHNELSSDEFMGQAEFKLSDLMETNKNGEQLSLQLATRINASAGTITVAVEFQSEEPNTLTVDVINGKDLPGLDSANEFVDMLAISMSRSLKHVKTAAKKQINTLAAVRAAYLEQFKEAIHPEGDHEHLTFSDVVMHVLCFFWKVVFSFIPPPQFAHGWLAFVITLVFIGALTAVAAELASLFGCVAGLSKTLTGITFVAVGTSLPDTFASRVAAIQSDAADSALGNITGSNAVNVFLGLGLPWTMGAIFWRVKCGLPFPAGAPGFGEGVIVFCAVAACYLPIMAWRRRAIGGEIGGSRLVAWASTLMLTALWMSYIGLSIHFEKNPIFHATSHDVKSIAQGCPAVGL